MKVLVIGDPHVTVEEIPDSENLLELVSSTADQEKPDVIVFLGDLFHSHSILHLPVLNFWEKWFTRLTEKHVVISLIGNHDQELKDYKVHALKPFKQIAVADPYYTYKNLAFASFHGPNRLGELLEFSQKNYEKVLFCHETFDGARYDNGFFASDGLDQEDFKNSTIISGHIHKPCQLGKVTYLGAPRWRTVSDANTDRYIYLLEIEGDEVLSTKKIPTKNTCKAIFTVSLPKDLDFFKTVKSTTNSRIIVTISGTESEVKKSKIELSALGLPNLTMKENITTSQEVDVKESLGVFEEFGRFKEEFITKHELNPNKFNELVNERFGNNL